MGIFDRLFGGGSSGQDDAPASMPWDARPSIYDHVCAHVDENESGLTDGGETLPDEERVNAGSQLRWAAGALDGVATHHMGGADQEEQVEKTVQLVLGYCSQPTAANKAALYQHIIEENTVSTIDAVIESLANQEPLNHERLYELSASFVTEATDREPVKFGVAILGLYQDATNESLFQTLGRHEEFTLFCAVALSNCSEEPDLALWTLARNVDGWGRIHVVERLAQTENEDIKRWLLLEGFRNDIMYEYLAYTCATAGGLLAALSEDNVDRELLTSAGELIQALACGGPAESMDDYEDGALVAQMFLQHMDSAATSLDDFLSVSAVNAYLTYDEADWEQLAENGWTSERRSELVDSCQAILDRPIWTDRIDAGLVSEDELEFHHANRAADVLGIDTWDHHWRRLQEKPTDSGRWYHTMATVDEQRLPMVLQLAAESIDLEAIATGPGDELGMGEGYEFHSCLDCMLQDLRRFPGHGAPLIEAGLRSPVVRNRNMAVAALDAWSDDQWTDSTREALQGAADVEPMDDVRERMTKVLNGEPLED